MSRRIERDRTLDELHLADIERYGPIVGPAFSVFYELSPSQRDKYGEEFFRAVENQMFAKGSTPEDRTKAIRALFDAAVEMALRNQVPKLSD